MLNKLYIIGPVILIIMFSFVYNSHVEEVRIKMAEEKAKAALIAAENTKKKLESEQKAELDARDQQEKRDRERRERDDEQNRKQSEADKKVADDTNAALKEGARLSQEITKFETQLADLHAKYDKTSKNIAALTKEVELTRDAGHASDMQTQQATETLVKRVETSTLAKMPPPPPKDAGL